MHVILSLLVSQTQGHKEKSLKLDSDAYIYPENDKTVSM